MDETTSTRIQQIIDQTNHMNIATIRPDGFPQATAVSYVNDGKTLFFATGADAQKTKNISANNKISVTINRPYETWEEISGISLGGTATRLTDAAEIEKVTTLLFKKFPQIVNYAPDDPEEVAFFRVDPMVISLLDYSKGFGHCDLVEV
ncbi:MAG: pyridoxamine 5'-phosphate oxidase family protein [Litoreibacter sp.]|nr:pyridoxamine 5'-phosphate oxidase family protein [Litoreibacter sp.]